MAQKIGDVFKIDLKDNNKDQYYLHLVALDELNLSSDVVIVYNGNPIGDISEAHPVFYTHVSVDAGIKQGLWKKVGSIEPEVNKKDLIFKNFRDADTIEINTGKENAEPEWAVWTVGDQKWKIEKYSVGRALNAENGGIAPPSDILYRIINGKSEFKNGDVL